MTAYTVVESPLGDVLLVGAHEQTTDGDGEFALTGVYFSGQRHEIAIGTGWQRDPKLLATARDQIHAYFAGSLTDFELRLRPRGSAFQRAVWDVLRGIPYGSTWSYGELAVKVADVSKVRAVAGAVGRNPLGIVIPCHRVIGANGSLTGYAAGLERKRWLLDLEARVCGATLPLAT